MSLIYIMEQIWIQSNIIKNFVLLCMQLQIVFIV